MNLVPTADHQLPKELRLVFGQTRHQRLFPKKHGFSYSSYFLRVPIHALSDQGQGNWLLGLNRRAVLSFRDSDHGDGKGHLHQWISNLLMQEGIKADGPIWLHSFARVLGFAFKPVSFWYCHDQQNQLQAIVAEVNNTFGERHVYLLRGQGQPIRWGQLMKADKQFHVSPFFRTEGHYEFRFNNTLESCVARIDYYQTIEEWQTDEVGPSQINLVTRAVLNTSLSGVYAQPTPRAIARAIFGYPLFSLAVVALIHWHALILWLGKRITFIPKPPPPTSLITRGRP